MCFNSKPVHRTVIILTFAALAATFTSSSSAASPDPRTSSLSAPAEALRQKQLSRLQAFANDKYQQAQELAAHSESKLPSQYQDFFTAATNADWLTMSNRYRLVNDPELRGTCWSPVLEIFLTWEAISQGEPKYTQMFIDDVLEAIPPGSIYFGATDPGRSLPTAFSKSHTQGDPFFTLTQNQLVDGNYREYLQFTYGAKLHTPSNDDWQKGFEEHFANAAARFKHDTQFPDEPKQIRPGEDVSVDAQGHLTISGPASVWSLNALFARLIFDQNTNRQFFVEESVPLDWMYPRLEPCGPILKLNRAPLPRLSQAVLDRDHAYWRKVCSTALGDWLNETTTVSNLVQFADRVFERKDFQGFTGDPRFVRNEAITQTFSKLRSSIANVYAWRLNESRPPESRPASGAERRRLLAETDLAFQQAYALCPYSPELTARYADFLVRNQRLADALLLARSLAKLAPSPFADNLAKAIETMQQRQ